MGKSDQKRDGRRREKRHVGSGGKNSMGKEGEEGESMGLIVIS